MAVDDSDFPEQTSIASDALRRLTEALEKSTAAAESRAKADKESAAASKAEAEEKKKQSEIKAANKQMADAIIDVAKEVGRVAQAGAKLSGTLGVSLSRGIALEMDNRNAITKQIFTIEANRMMTMEQMASAEQSFAGTFLAAKEGFQLSADGAADFGSSLKTGFKSDFTLTGDAMKALITAGVSTEGEFENLRKASGLASIGNQQLATMVNKNSLSFMLYGPKFAKAAVEAERLGISLASVQAAQESMVTNLDGTIDTIAQINQLGGQVDFGTLTRLNEFEGPQATLKYLQSTIPPALFQSASTRALLKGFGISVEDLMKTQESTQASAANKIEQSLTKLEEKAIPVADVLGNLLRKLEEFMNTWGGLLKALAGLAIVAYVTKGLVTFGGALFAMAARMFPALGTSGLGARLLGGGGAPPMLGPQLPPGGLAGAPAPVPPGGGMGGFNVMNLVKGAFAMVLMAGALYILAKAFQQFNQVKEGVILPALGAIAGLTLVMAGLGLLMTTPAGAAIFVGIGGLALMAGALAVTGLALKVMGDGFASLNPGLEKFSTILNGLSIGKMAAFAAVAPFLALGGTAFAGISAAAKPETPATTPPAASAQAPGVTKVTTEQKITTTTQVSNTDLVKKIEQLITTLNDAKTVINVGDRTESVPRLGVRQVSAGAYERNQRT